MPHRHPTFGEWIVEHVRIEQIRFERARVERARQLARQQEAAGGESTGQAGQSDPTPADAVAGNSGFVYDVDSQEFDEAAAKRAARRAA
jgi:hypothetical protein